MITRSLITIQELILGKYSTFGKNDTLDVFDYRLVSEMCWNQT